MPPSTQPLGNSCSKLLTYLLMDLGPDQDLAPELHLLQLPGWKKEVGTGLRASFQGGLRASVRVSASPFFAFSCNPVCKLGC